MSVSADAAAGRRRADRRRLPGRGARGGRALRADRAGRRARDRGQPLLLRRPAQRPAPAGVGAVDARGRPARRSCWTTRLAALDCRLDRLVAAGDHVLALLEVEDVPVLDAGGRARCCGCAAATSTSPGGPPPAPDRPRGKCAGRVSHPGRGGAVRVWTSCGSGRPRRAASRPARRGPAAEGRRRVGCRRPGARPGRPRGGLPQPLRAGRRRRRAGARLPRPGRGRRPGGLPLLRPLHGAGRRGPRLAVRRRDPHRPQPAPLRPASRRPRGGRRRRPDRRPRRRRRRRHPRGARAPSGPRWPGCPTSRPSPWCCGTAA